MHVLSPHFDHVAIRFRAGLGGAEKRAVARTCRLAPYRAGHDLPGESFALVPLESAPGPAHRRHAEAVERLAAHRHVVRVAAVARHGRSLVIATDRIWVGLCAGARGKAVVAGLRRRGCRLVERRGADHLIRLPAAADPHREIARLQRLAAVEYAEPDHVLVGPPSAVKTGGRIQAALRAVRAPAAWKLQPIGPDTVVAVLDNGVLASHPDLRGAVTSAFDATRRGSARRPSPWDSHGTECAGLVGATGRAARGIRGMAAGCAIAAVRIGYTPSRLADYVTKVSWTVAGIDWAWQHGAAVLSMSFGGGPAATPVVRALRRARTQGRGGRGCVLVAAVGNSGVGTVEFPASSAGVVGVAAVGSSGRRAPFSNWGSQVALAAPGVNVATTTIPDPSDGEPSLYFADSGTSLSTPLVAGAAALVLAAAPKLTERAVRGLLAATASGRGRRVAKLGAGVIDAAAAVRRAQELAGAER